MFMKKSFAKVALIAALGLAAGAAFASDATISGNTVNQDQSGSQNQQSLEAGVVDTDSPFGSSSVQLTNNTISQTQSGNNNIQTALIGKVDKILNGHNVTVDGNTFTQTQSGDNNRQSLKIGVVE
jgi:hypothetical protein